MEETEYTAADRERPRKRKRPFGGWLRYMALLLVFVIVSAASFAGISSFLGSFREETAATGEYRTEKQQSQKTPEEDAREETGKESAGEPAQPAASGGLTDVSGIAQNVLPAIVGITNVSEATYQGWFGRPIDMQQQSAGSGILIEQDDDTLYIATNNHVVANATSLTVQFCDGSTAAAQIKGTDESNDLAVAAVRIGDLESGTYQKIMLAAIGDSTELRVGETAVAIGNALGYGQSVTTGVISALGREVSVTDETTGNVFTSELIQTDAAINPGNSGGALLNLRGEVIGINSVKYSNTYVEGMGYAIPMETASPIIDRLIHREPADRSQAAYLGISGVDVSGSVSESYNMPEGIYVYRVVEGSAAERAGIAQGDIITKFEGSKISTKRDLEDQIRYYSAGTQITLTVQRLSNENNGQYVEREITVTLGRKN